MDPKAKRVLIAATTIFLSISVVAVVLAIYENNKNPYPNYINIANLDDFTTGKPTDRDTLNFIRYALFNTISYNLDRPLANGEIEDVLIRPNSFLQTYNEATKAHSVSFIVDIESLQQSYGVRYQWSNNRSFVTAEYSTLVFCLPIDQLIFSDFRCKYMMSSENQVSDPIMRHLPHSTLNFRITAGGLDNGKLTLNITITLSAYDERTNPDAAIDSYKTEVTNWIKSIDQDPNDYNLNYNIVRASLF